MKYAVIVFTLILVVFCASAQSKGTIWEVNQFKVKDSTEIQLFKEYVQTSMGKPRDEGLKLGYLVSYKILVRNPEENKGTSVWDVMLMTEYKDTDQMHLFAKEYTAISSKVVPKGYQLNGKRLIDFAKPMLYVVLQD